MSVSTPPTSPAAYNNTSLTLNSSSKPVSRRRTSTFMQKKTNIEMLVEGGTNEFSDGNANVTVKNLNHTTRGGSVLERSKDILELKRELAAPIISYRRKKSVSKPEVPKRETGMGIFSRTCLLLVGLLWLGQMIWRWTITNGNNTIPPFATLEYEGRISEVEASFKRMTQMLQVQLEVVDKKIGSQIMTVSMKLKQAEERGTQFEKELAKLVAGTDNLDKSLSELKNMGFITKAEFESFRKCRSLDGNDGGASLDDIRIFAKEIVEKEIEKHAADGLGRVDYALASGGARVVRHSEPYGFGKATNWFSVTKGLNEVQVNAQKMLEPSFGDPGQCFALQGSNGFVEIRLRTWIIPEAVTLEHVSKCVAYDRSSAPKDCRVSAWLEGPDDDPSNHRKNIFLLTDFSYDLEKNNAQTFNIEPANSSAINMVRFEFSSNHGSSSLTCIYRIRVHGYEPVSRYGISGLK